MILPTLLAGPILRRVVPASVTVWVAFSKKQATQLVIWDSDKEEGNATTAAPIEGFMAKSDLIETTEIATNLHIGVITVDTTAKPLIETKAYSYNVYYGNSGESLDQDLGTSKLLHPPSGISAEKFVALGYDIGNLPTIVVPPKDLINLHIVHGSCRKIHGGGDDAFRHLDTLLKKTIQEAKTDVTKLKNRPQQLFLTGDQIYADEIPALILPFINALGSQLFGDVKEKLITKSLPLESVPADMENVPPNCRQWLINGTAKFTGNGTPSHLVSFQEFCSTYLYYWSPGVWNPEIKLMLDRYKESNYDDDIGSFHYYYLINLLKNFKTEARGHLLFNADTPEGQLIINNILAFQDKLKNEPPPLTTPQNDLVNKWNSVYNNPSETVISDFNAIVKMLQYVDEEQKSLLSGIFSMNSVLSESRSSFDFLQVVPLARRAMANIPTYMIFDDHDMTDDWNFSRFWKNRVHTSSLGIQILRNALMAYTVFQDWGNVPEEYPYNLLHPSADAAANKTLTENYRNTFGKTKGNKLDLLKRISEYGKAISRGTSPEAPASLSNSIDTLLLVGEDPPKPDMITPVRWHFDIASGGAHTFFLDTRTRREFDDFIIAPGLLSKEALDDQLPERIALQNYSAVFVISPVPALSLPVIEEFAQPLEGAAEGGLSGKGVGGAPTGAISGALKRDNEGWGFSEKHLEQLLERLAIFKKVVILSGDVHFGFSTYVDYWKERKEVNHARIIQLVSSPFKNGWGLEFTLLKSGFAQRLLAGFDYEFEKHGWKNKTLKVKGNMAPRHRIRLSRDPVVLPRQGWYKGTTVEPAEPDWVWRLRIGVDEKEYKNNFPLLPLEIANDLPESFPVDATREEKIAKAKITMLQMADRHNSLFKLGVNRRIIWQPNIGHVFFTNIEGDPSKFAVNHEFHYTCRTDGFLNSDYSPDPDTAGVFSGPFTLHTINLDGIKKVSSEGVVDKTDEVTIPKTLNEN